LVHDPLHAFEAIGAQSGGQIARLGLGLFRPYLVTRPEHVQHVLRDNGANYLRDGMMWRPLRRLFGDGLGGEGAQWEPSRRLIQPLFSARTIADHTDVVAGSVAAAVDDLQLYGDEPVDAEEAMTRIAHRALIGIFFGGRIGPADGDRLGHAIATAFTSIGARMLLPFVPQWTPLPGDHAFRRAIATVDDILLPLVRACRQDAQADRGDIASLLCLARDDSGEGLDDRRIRDDIIALFAGGTETTAVALTWLWSVLDSHPQVAASLYEEVDRVIGRDAVGPAHLPHLKYTKMVLQELLRLYPPGWIIPRTVRARDVIDGVRVPAGATVLLSPYLTHRLPQVWDRPDVFDPLRFDPERATRRHRFAYFPFSGGAHHCLGGHLFTVEAQLVVAAMLSRFRITPVGTPPRPRAAVSLRPDRRIQIILRPHPNSR
jgi:cytochrome P450